MIENIRGMVSNKKNKIIDEQTELKAKIESMNSEIDVLDQINTAIQDDSYFLKITPNDAFSLLKQIGFESHKEMMNSYMQLVSADYVEETKEQNTNFETKSEEHTTSVPSFDNSLKFEMPSENKEQYSSKYQQYVVKIENPTDEMTEENKMLMNSCMQAINESVLSDSKSYFLGDITISKEKVSSNMEKLFRGKISPNDVLPMLTVGMSYGTTSDESIMDEILDYLKALQVKAN